MELESLLIRIRDGVASLAEIDQARALVVAEVRLPEDLRQEIDFRDDAVGDAVGLLAVLGADSLFGEVLREGVAADLAEPAAEASNREEIVLDEVWPLGEVLAQAVRHEAGEVELVPALFSALGLELERVPVAEAVREEAGEVELREALDTEVEGAWVSAMVDGELGSAARSAAIERLRAHPEAGATMTTYASLGRDIRKAVAEEMGEVPYIWAGVAEALGVEAEAVPGWDGEAFAAAVREEAGAADLADAVMNRVVVRRPSVLEAPEPMPEPANNNSWSWGNLLMAGAIAAAVLLVAVPTAFNKSQRGDAPGVELASAQFASAGEIVIENLAYGENSNVSQMMGDEGALILWVDERNVQ